MSNNVNDEQSVTEKLQALREALECSDAMVLRAALYCVCPDEDLFDLKYGSEKGLFGPITTIDDPDEIAKIHAKAFEVCERLWRGELSGESSRETLIQGMNLCAGEEIPDKHVEVSLEESGLIKRQTRWSNDKPPANIENYNVLVIGAGLGGLMAAVRLREMGLPYTMVEKNKGVGGTWYANHYPGVRIDVPSHFYSYPWENDYHWEHVFAPQAEIQAYFQMVAEKYQVLDTIQFETEVVATRWLDDENLWEATLRTQDGTESTVRANAVISATGLLDRPSVPDIAGLDSFEGRAIHTAQWDDDLDLSGKRVAIIGTGATGMQIAPAIAPDVSQLTVFQRNPAWVLPMDGYHDKVDWEVDWLRDNIPTYGNWLRFRMFFTAGDNYHGVYEIDPEWDTSKGSLSEANHYMRTLCYDHLIEKLEGRDDLVQKCTPNYPPMVTRFVLDNGWFEAIRRDNVDVNVDGIKTVTKTGIITNKGESIDLDVIILATGFSANRFMWPMEVTGRGGLKLEDFWAPDGGRAYMGINMPGFPNYFCLYGPNTNPSSNSPFAYDECQIGYALESIKYMIENDCRGLDLRKKVFDEFQQKLDKELEKMIWMDQSAKSYYRNEHGRVATNSPWLFNEYRDWTLRPNVDEYEIIR